MGGAAVADRVGEVVGDCHAESAAEAPDGPTVEAGDDGSVDSVGGQACVGKGGGPGTVEEGPVGLLAEALLPGAGGGVARRAPAVEELGGCGCAA